MQLLADGTFRPSVPPLSGCVTPPRRSFARPDFSKDEESGIEEIELKHLEEVIEPPQVFQCDNNCQDFRDREDLIKPEESCDKTKVLVGTPPNRWSFIIHKALLRRYSEYFRVALRENNPRPFRESSPNEIIWPDDDPEDLDLFVEWVYSCGPSLHVPLWDRGRARIYPWDRILAPEYSRFALASVIQHIHLFSGDRVLWTYDNVRRESSMGRFIYAWIAWLKFKHYMTPASKKEAEASVTNWYAKGLGYVDGWSALDPRKYLMEHWSEPCSLPGTKLHCGQRRPAWFWRRKGGTQPGKAPPKPKPKVRPPNRRARKSRASRWLLRICLWFSMAMLVLSAYIIARDREGVILHSSKALGVAMATISLFSICTECWAVLPWGWVPVLAMAMGAAVFSFVLAGRCIDGALAAQTAAPVMCQLEAGLSGIQLLFFMLLSITLPIHALDSDD
ncbi:hypothetical protein GE09DRAFT_1287265 [Coniochaeta sp. 2T2.1]|nr:hypothetical protein GE09DRAFT_1287265 [Coniochaeta sp. 2T2.1]